MENSCNSFLLSWGKSHRWTCTVSKKSVNHGLQWPPWTSCACLQMNSFRFCRRWRMVSLQWSPIIAPQQCENTQGNPPQDAPKMTTVSSSSDTIEPTMIFTGTVSLQEPKEEFFGLGRLALLVASYRSHKSPSHLYSSFMVSLGFI